MSLPQSLTIQAYQLRPGGAPARLAILRRIAADSANNAKPQTRLNPGDWKGARNYGLASYAAAYCHGLNPGFNGEGYSRSPVWYSHSGPNFRDESDAQNGTRGWYTDSECYDVAIGIVGRLTHGRFIAGYRWTSNDERVYFPEVFDCEDSAARMADEHARCFAESAREDSERFDAMQRAEIAADDAAETVRDALALRRTGRRTSDDVREAIEALREARETLADATRAYERG